jgi:hypothetical protein
VGVFVGMGVEDGIGVLVTAAAVSDDDIPSSSSGEVPQAEIMRHKINVTRMYIYLKVNISLILLVGDLKVS